MHSDRRTGEQTRYNPKFMVPSIDCRKMIFVLVIISLTNFVMGATPTAVPAGNQTIAQYPMHMMCGRKINMIWHAIYTGSVNFDRNSTSGHLPSSIDIDQNRYRTMATCDFGIESWNFHNRIMFYFKTLELGANCSDTHLQIFDGPSEEFPTVEGLPRTVCGHHAHGILSRAYVTTEKYMYIRYHNNNIRKEKARFAIVFASFREGKCNSFEHTCNNGHCIMSELTCNGGNPCGDNSDCPINIPQEVVTADESPALVAAIVSISCAIVFTIVGIVVFCICYKARRKHRRDQQYLDPLRQSSIEPEISVQPSGVLRSESQIEAEQLHAPPSYNSLSIIPDQSDSDVTSEEPEPDDRMLENCLETDEQNPPSYVCVMLHKDAFHLSDSEINRSNSVSSKT